MSFDAQPTLTGESLILRPLFADDWDGLFAVGSDPGVWALHPVSGRYQEEAFRAYFTERLACGGALVALDRVTGAVIGSSSFAGYDGAKRSIEIGWTFLARPSWGGSTNREMKRLMLAHAFRFVDQVTFRIGENNVRSRAAIEKIGGILTDRVDPVVIDGITINHVTYAITKTGFYATGLGMGYIV